MPLIRLNLDQYSHVPETSFQLQNHLSCLTQAQFNKYYLKEQEY